MMIRRDLALLVATVSVVAIACGAPGAAATATAATPSVPPSPNPSLQPSPTPSPTLAASAVPLQVTGLDVKADPADHVGRCPLEITFSGRISVSGSAGTVSYKWISSDGDASPLKTLTFAGPGSQDVSSSWTVNRDTVPTHAGWSAIEILEPVSATANGAPSARAAFTFTCDTDDDVEAIGFGIGGSDADCSIAKAPRTFAPSDPIRVVANWWPSLAAGTVVTIRLTRGDELIDGYPVTTNLRESTSCIHGSVSSGFLAAGHYRLDVVPDTARAVGGEFDVK